MDQPNAEYSPVINDGAVKLPPDYRTQLERARLYLVSLLAGHYAVGSATLVSIGGKCGFLTARHVWEEITRNCEQFTVALGNVGEFQGLLRGLECRVADCRPMCIGTRDVGRPDLAFIELTSAVDWQKIHKVNPFYRLEREKLAMLGRYAANKMPLMVLGTVADNADQPTSSPPPIRLFIGEGDRLTNWTKDSPWDYCEIKMRSGQGSYPNDFHGMSGGGCWTLAVEELAKGKFGAPHLFLVGVIIEQLPLKGGFRQIVLHGPASIYSGIVAHVSSDSSSP